MDAGKPSGAVNVYLDKMIQPTMLLLIYQKPSHGYELIQSFNALDPAGTVEPGTIYRNLRRMESDGLVVSTWETSESGPARRQYNITALGLESLREAAARLEHQMTQIQEFLQLYRKLAEEVGDN